MLVETMCSVCTERDVHLVRDVSCGRDVCLRQEEKEHISSLCGKAAKHHYAARHIITCAGGAIITVIFFALYYSLLSVY